VSRKEKPRANGSGLSRSRQAGSIDEFDGYRPRDQSSFDAALQEQADRLATAVPEIYALTNLSEHVVLNVVDALICQYEGGERGLLHYSSALNQIRVSGDPVALDMLSLKELDAQRQATKAPEVRPNIELYNNAALLELGVSNLKKIKVEFPRQPGHNATTAQQGDSKTQRSD